MVDLQQNNQATGSWLGRLADKIKGQPSAPPSPHPPGVAPEGYDHARLDTLTVRQVANIVANEDHDVEPGHSSDEHLQQSRIAQAHAVINGDLAYGPQRDQMVKTAPKEVTGKLENSEQYQRALDAARVAFQEHLAGKDPTGGRMYFNRRFTSSTLPREVGSEEVDVHQQFGPFQWGHRTVYTNSYDNPKRNPKPRGR
jgi:hypothetical protein